MSRTNLFSLLKTYKHTVVICCMSLCFFTSDLHGKLDRYKTLFKSIREEKPSFVLLGGDLLPSGLYSLLSEGKVVEDFINDFLIPNLNELKNDLGDKYPFIGLILGNDDGKTNEHEFIDGEKHKLWKYLHNKHVTINDFKIYGYSYIPPSPFILKDWEKYDVSRYVDPGCISPEDGKYTVKVDKNIIKYSTIQKDLEKLIPGNSHDETIILFHSPPYKTNLDRAELDGKMIDHVPLDVNVGSIAIHRFIESKQPYLTLHGHVHESTRLTGQWKDKIGSTYMFSGAHDGPELALVKFDISNLSKARRELI